MITASYIVKALVEGYVLKLRNVNDDFVGKGKDSDFLRKIKGAVADRHYESASVISKYDNNCWLLVISIPLSKVKEVELAISVALSQKHRNDDEFLHDFQDYGSIYDNLEYDVSGVAYMITNGHSEVSKSKDFMIPAVDGINIINCKVFSQAASVVKRLIWLFS